MTGSVIPGPRSLIDLFDEAFDLYKRNAALILLVILVVHIPGWIVLQAIAYLLFSGIGEMREPGEAFSVLGRFTVFSLAFFLVYLMQAGPLTIAVSDRYLGQPSSFRRAYRGMLSTYPRLLATGLIVFVIGLTASAIVVFLMLLGIGIMVSGAGAGAGQDSPAVWIAVIVVIAGMAVTIPAISVWIVPFTVPACIIERLGPFGALARNGMLAASGYWRTFRALFVLPALWLSIVFALDESGDFVWQYLIKPVITPSHVTSYVGIAVWRTAVLTFVNPMVIIFLTLLYYDARVRREGFDLALLQRSLAEAAQ